MKALAALAILLMMSPVQVMTMEVTAYTENYASTGKAPGHPLYGLTASGATVQAQHTIACPPSLGFGTRVYIPAMGELYTCQDRGAAITDHGPEAATEGHLDIYMEQREKALAFGRRELEAWVLQPDGELALPEVEVPELRAMAELLEPEQVSVGEGPR